MLVVIDPGHGGKDPGASVDGYLEKDINLNISLKLKDILIDKKIDVIMTREKDETVDLKLRCEIANKNNADYFISVHCNSSKDKSANGSETYSYPGSQRGRNLAQYVQNSIVEMLGTKNRGVKYAEFYVLKYTLMPAILVETAFMSNPENLKLLFDESFIFAEAIAEGFFNFLKTISTEQDRDVDRLRQLGIINEYKDSKAYVTWGDVASVVIKVLEVIK